MKTKMRKSASAANFKIDFNPNQIIVGQSSIDKLPIRRKTSVQSLYSRDKNVQLKRPPLKKQIETQNQQISHLKRVNESLERENQRLKKQLQYYIQQGINSRRSSFAGKKQEDYKDRIMNRIQNKSRFLTKVDQQSTGLSTTKNSRYVQDSLLELYEKYSSKRIIPSLENVYEVGKEYFTEFKENYIKLKILFDNAQGQESKLKKKIEELLYLFRVPILYKENPSILAKSLSKEKKEKGKETEKYYPELTSPMETLLKFQNLMKIISKSPKIMQKIKSSPYYLYFDKKIKSL